MAPSVSTQRLAAGGPARWRSAVRRALGATDLAAVWRAPAGRVLVGACAALLVLTLVGLVALWPGDRPGGKAAFGGDTRAAEVTAVQTVTCPGPAGQRCRRIQVRLQEGPDAGRTVPITLGPVGMVTQVDDGEAIRVSAIPGVPVGGERYGFSDADRRAPLLWLGLIVVLVVVVLARWRGLLALVGFALSLGLVTQFLIPAMLAGSPPLLVALVAALAVMWVTVGLTYGVHPTSMAAALGIAAALALAAGLGWLWVGLAHLDGRSSELSAVLVQQDGTLDLQGVVLAGMVIGALGVLADTGITQASAVLALRRASPGLSPRRLYAEALAVGRDHLTATVHTLVLAYVGATLPLVLVLSGARVGTVDAVTSQDLAEPIVATLVGALALLAAVPLTTGLAAVLTARVPTDALGDAHHGHSH